MRSSRLRHITLLLTMLGILFSTQGGLVAHVAFYLRQDYIAKHLCENRHIPHSHCHGKCYLKKRLAQAEKESKPPAAAPAVSPVAFFLTPGRIAVLAPPERRASYPTTAPSRPVTGHPSRVDPPPRLV